MDAITFLLTVFMIFVAMPWIIINAVTRWKKSGTLTREDENLLDELHNLARRLDDRVRSVERIVTVDNPGWHEIACEEAPESALQDRNDNLRRIK